MTPEEIDTVRNSFGILRAAGVRFAEALYRELFALDPTLRARFPAAMDEQRRKFDDMLAAIVEGLDAPAQLAQACAALGTRHAGYGATEDDYDTMGAALLRTVRHALGDDCPPEVEEAWAAAYGTLAETMIAAARAAGAAPAGAGA